MPSVRADTPLPTPSGWSLAGELRPGDYVFSASGEPVQVVVVNHEQVSAAIELKMVLDPFVVSVDHDACLGLPWYLPWEGPKELAKERAARLANPLAPVRRVKLKMPARPDLPLDPWAYGYWRILHLPDGVIGVKEHLEQRARELLEKAGLSVSRTFRDRDMVYITSADLAVAVDKIGEWDGFHPDYMRAGEQQRRELLAGAVDARGRFMNGVTVETGRPVATHVVELAMSLGLRASMLNRGLPRVRMSAHDAPMFLREEELHDFLHGPKRPGYRMEVPYMIRGAQPAGRGDFVQVRTTDGTYLVSRAMIPVRDN